MERFYRLMFGVSRAAAITAAVAMVFMVAIIAWEIVLRWFFSTSTFVTAEFVGYAMMLCIIWSLAYALECGQLIRVQLLLTHLPKRAGDWLTAISALVVACAVLGLMFVYWTRATRAYQRGTVSSSVAAMPLWVVESIMLIGLAVFVAQLFAYALRHITGHPSPAHQLEQSVQE